MQILTVPQLTAILVTPTLLTIFKYLFCTFIYLLFLVTTIQPELGVVTYPDFRKIQFADLPGLIEGAHENKVLEISHRLIYTTV